LRRLAAIFVVWLSTFAVFAQSGEMSVWKGELRSDSLNRFEGYIADLLDNHNQRAGSTDVRSDGEFEFKYVTEGDYRLVIATRDGQVVYDNFVRIPGNPGPFEARIREERVERPPSGPVSVTQLLHPPQRKAIQFFAEAQKFSETGDYARAANELEKAVRISPDFADAHTNLGAQYLRLGRYLEAQSELERSIEIAPNSVLTMSNLAYCRLMLGRPAEAAEAARRALRLDSASAPAHYVLGMSLVTVAGRTPEAIAHLEKAAETMPGAKRQLDRLMGR
jgi:tetratricopeptide (TPR) repeat protein